jgi:hypothetical protein
LANFHTTRAILRPCSEDAETRTADQPPTAKPITFQNDIAYIAYRNGPSKAPLLRFTLATIQRARNVKGTTIRAHIPLAAEYPVVNHILRRPE